MEIYRLTPTGKQMAHIVHYHGKPRQMILYYLYRVHQSSKERILENVRDATLGDIYMLKRKGLIEQDMEA